MRGATFIVGFDALLLRLWLVYCRKENFRIANLFVRVGKEIHGNRKEGVFGVDLDSLAIKLNYINFRLCNFVRGIVALFSLLVFASSL